MASELQTKAAEQEDEHRLRDNEVASFKRPVRSTLEDAAEFARTYVGPRLPRRRDRLVRVIEEVSGEASGRAAAHMFRAWALAEGLLAEESYGPRSGASSTPN